MDRTDPAPVIDAPRLVAKPPRQTSTPDDAPPARRPTPRSAHDLKILRSLARRLPPHDAGAHNNLGVLYYQKSLHEEAIEQFERALDVDPSMQVARRNLQIAYFSTGYFERLVGELRGRLQVDPGDQQARLALARAYLDTGDAAAALVELRRVQKHRPDDLDLVLRIARAEREKGDLDAALGELRHARALDPGHARVNLQIGEILYNGGQREEAKLALEEAVRAEPALAAAHLLLAFVYGDLGDEAKASAASERAAELNPSYSKAETNLSLDRYSEARFDELVGARDERISVTEGLLEHYNLGLGLRQRGMLDEAEREFTLALENDEDRDLVRQAQAELWLLRGDAVAAAKSYGELLRADPASPKLWNEQGIVLHLDGRTEEAEQCYRRALELDESYTLAWNNLAVVLHHRDRAAAAENSFRQALDGDRAPGDIWRNLGLLLAHLDRKQEALTAYTKASELSPDSAPVWTGVGTLLLETGRQNEARTALVRAVELDPEHAEARYQLAFALSASGDYQGALRETRRALELNPLFPAPRFRLLIDLQFEDAGVFAPELDVDEQVTSGGGIREFDFGAVDLSDVFAPWQEGPREAGPTGAARALENARVALSRGEYERAAAEAGKALAPDGPRQEALLLLGDVFLRRGFAGEALERFRAARDEAIGSDSGGASREAFVAALLGSGRALALLERWKEAADAMKELLEARGDSGEARRLLGEAQLRSGEARAAAVTLAKATSFASQDARVWTLLGEATMQSGDPMGAEAAFRTALEVDPDATAPRLGLARLFIETERADEAASMLRKAVELLPSYGDAALALAALEMKRGRGRIAIEVLADLLTADPYHLDGLYLLGRALEAAGRVEAAGVAYERVLKLDPGRRLAGEALARLERIGT